MSEDRQIILESAEISSLTAFFDGTIVPVSTLFKYLAAGKSIDMFLTDFPFISREQVLATLDQVAYGVKYEPEPPRPVFRWLLGALLSPFAVACAYLLWTEWKSILIESRPITAPLHSESASVYSFFSASPSTGKGG